MNGGGEPVDALQGADYSAPDSPLIRSVAAEVPADLAGLRFDQALARLFPQHSRNRLQNWVREGRVLLDDRPADAKRKVWGGERVTLVPAEHRSEASFKPEEIPLRVLYEDACLLAVDKPAGLVVHPGSGNWEGTLLNALLHHAPQLEGVPRAGIVHRLDKETSGLLVVAKTIEAQTALVRELQARTVKRDYLALVHGKPKPAQGTVDAPIARHRVERTRMAVDERGKTARTHYRSVEAFADATLLECSLDTGRTHQIRVHMHSIGRPLVGDPTYGRRGVKNEVLKAFPRQALHAARLALTHPESGETLTWESPLPEDFAHLLETLRR
jgi:23S rRNA pseudouridine1911/1915/1917 synthase